MPPIMANSKDGQGHKGKYHDTSRNLVKRNAHGQYRTHFSKVISKVKFKKKWVFKVKVTVL